MTLTRQESIHTAVYNLKSSSEFVSCGIYNLNGPTPSHKTIIVDVVSKYNLNKMPKEWGFFCTYYTYLTVCIINAANLTLLLLKGSKLRKGNKNEDFGLHCPLRFPRNIQFLGGS
jgi:hypothetical protein